jgi:hypothetical protein
MSELDRDAVIASCVAQEDAAQKEASELFMLGLVRDWMQSTSWHSLVSLRNFLMPFSSKGFLVANWFASFVAWTMFQPSHIYPRLLYK